MNSVHGVLQIRALRSLAVAALCAGALFVAREARAQQAPAGAAIEQARAALAKYQDPVAAVHDGYLSMLVCIEYPGGAGGPGRMPYKPGGMGVHFLNPGLIGRNLDPLHPQALIYEPHEDKLQLVAAEWFVPVDVAGTTAPTIFGRALDGPMEGHYPIMPAAMHHWDLHVWLWKDNPSGMFSPTNPTVRCPTTGYSFAEEAPKLVAP